MAYCPNGGKKIEDGAKFCGDCGTKIDLEMWTSPAGAPSDAQTEAHGKVSLAKPGSDSKPVSLAKPGSESGQSSSQAAPSFSVQASSSAQSTSSNSLNSAIFFGPDGMSVGMSAEETVSPKSRLCALLLGIFFGYLGIHNLYLGKIKRGIIQMVMSVLGLYPYVRLVAYAIKAVIAETNGAPVSDDDFPIGVILLFILSIFLFAIVGIWAFVDWIVIAVGKARDKNGLPLLKW
jgi:hypothetical protein